MQTKEYLNSSAGTLVPSKGKAAVYPAEMNDAKLYQKEKRRARNEGLTHLYNNDYKPAVYRKAVQFKNSMSYKKKIGEDTYKQIQLFENTDQLKAFGLGPYFFIEFQRRVVWLFLVLSLMCGVLIYINAQGQGLQKYKGSFGTFLVTTTIANFDANVLSGFDTYLLATIPCGMYLAIVIFYFIWKYHYAATIKEEDQDKEFIKPEKFCVEVEGFGENDDVREDELEEIFSGFGPVYEVSLAREYSGNLQYFEKLDELEEEIKEEELEIILGSGDAENLKALRKEKEELNKYINTLRIKPSVKSAYIHYQFEKSKVDMLQYFSDHYLFSQKLSHSMARAVCCCCVDDPEKKYTYKGKTLFIHKEKVPEPEDINWSSYEVGVGGKICRVLFVALIILVFLAASCTIIGLCSIYISSHSVSCEGVFVPPTVAEAIQLINTEKGKKCFCSTNFISSFSDTAIKDYCGTLLTQIYTEQGIQYAITATSTIVNILFGIVVHKLIPFTQPMSLSTGFIWRTSIITVFLIFNTVFLPLLIYADIFGFKTTEYVSFITIISTDIRSFFQVDTIKLYIDFEKIWYRNVSSIFTNYMILDTILTWVFFVLYRCCCTKDSLETKEGTILQKNMNEQIISWKLNIADEYAMFNLIIFMSVFYSGGVPVLIPIALVNLFSKYVSNRSLLQNVSSRVEGLSEAFNVMPFTLLPLLLVLACLFGEWMISANSTVAALTTMRITIAGLNNEIVNRHLLFPFYLILALAVVFYFLFWNTIVRFCSWLSECCYDRKQVVHPYLTKEYSQYVKGMSIMHSYNIRNNIKYKNIIINLEKYLDRNDSKLY